MRAGEDHSCLNCRRSAPAPETSHGIVDTRGLASRFQEANREDAPEGPEVALARSREELLLNLQWREITAADSELLLQLDQGDMRGQLPSPNRAGGWRRRSGGGWVRTSAGILTEQQATTLCMPSSEDHLGKTCSICLADFELNEDVTCLPCSHLFHKDCILAWLTRGRATCPLDNTEV